MKIELKYTQPSEIERQSMETISRILLEQGIHLAPENESVIRRVIHTTADFDYAQTLSFSPDAVERGRAALRRGACIVTDTRMAGSGLNKKRLAEYGGEVFCFIADQDVVRLASDNSTTRAVASMEKASRIDRELIFAIGNAPTALVRLYELIAEGKLSPALVIGVPVGFVNVVESKELFVTGGPGQIQAPHIIARGRKGGSNVAAAIVNALLYGM